jgi:thioredoxin reductase
MFAMIKGRTHMNPRFSGTEELPVAIIGAGPVGLAAAVHLATRQQPFIVLESGSEVGAAIRAWGHVAMFSPWRYNVDRAARSLLADTTWRSPDDDSLPTGNDIVDRYLVPLSKHPSLAPHIRLNTRVRAVGRKDFDKVRTKGREEQPFVVHVDSGEVIEARAVIDATGTWGQPNPAGSGGHPVPGERELADRVSYGIPAVLGSERTRFAGKRVAVVGSGHSAINVVLDLLTLAGDKGGTEVVWIMRRESLESVWGGGADDALAARGLLGARARQAVEDGRLEVRSPYRIRSIASVAGRLEIAGVMRGDDASITADEIIVATGFRPDLEMLKEVRLSIDPWLECTSALGPLIDPNEHSCGTVRPHGARELTHPEKDFFVVGMKSYGRAPTFLLATGYEQVRSVAAWLAGDAAAAERVELELPETGVCSVTDGASSSCCGTSAVAPSATESDTAAAASACCGGPAPADVDACCVQDADAKSAGAEGCGCGTSVPQLVQIGGSARR